MSTRRQGFTLIELMVVISIISLLSSIVLATLNNIRAKALDTKKIAEMHSISQALHLYYSKYNKYPGENRGTACDFIDDTGGYLSRYNTAMQELVDEKLLSEIPRTPKRLNNTIFGGSYCYLNYGSSQPSNATIKPGAVIKTTLETGPLSSIGIPPTCRPFTANTWCTQTDSREYCLCHPY